MARIYEQRMMAEIEGDFVVFIIGMRINRPWKVYRWLPVFTAMPGMIRELYENPESGLLGINFHFGFPVISMVQYWRSFEQLERYARSKDRQHYPAWVAFNKQIGSHGDVGIFHETYLVKAGNYETLYNNMPAIGLGAAAKLVTVSEKRQNARDRLAEQNSAIGTR